MNNLKIDCAIKLKFIDKENFISGCYSNEYYNFLCLDKPQILIFNSELNYYTSFPTKRIFSSITYDTNEKVFFAISTSVKNTIFKLNLYMEEISIIKILGFENQNLKINAITYDECKKNLFLSTNTGILEVTKDGLIKNENLIQDISSAFTYPIGSCIFYLSETNEKISLKLYENFKCLSKTNYLKTEFQIKNIIDGYYDENSNIFRLYCLSQNKKLEYYLVCLIVSNCCLNTEYDCESHCDCHCDSCTNSNCNECPSCETIENENCQKSICDILESIALMEASLAHILNAEGEKLQKGICIANTVSELVCLNASVEKTITKITNLESHLYSKLVTTQELLNEMYCNKR